jgi:superfamily II DNA/RNA helicase
VICDDARCHLFFARDDGKLYRSKVTIQDFPNFSGYETVISDTVANLFEAPNVYKVDGTKGLGARTEALEQFKASNLRVLVATDLAARGLDIAQLPAVGNYGLPRSAADYLRRSGRTWRAGERGVAVSFVSADSTQHFRLIEYRHRLCVEREQVPGFEPREVAEPPLDQTAA